MSAIRRRPLRELVREEIVHRVISGELEPGQDLNESKLAAELGVSRTPLREALIWLEFQDIVGSEPGRGFFIRPLDLQAATDLYTLVAKLEGLALLQCEGFTDELLEKLQSLDERREACLGSDPVACFEADMEWHATLVSRQGNAQLAEVLRLLKLRQSRYEHHFIDQPQAVRQALSQHQAIIDRLRDDRLDEAAALLQRHWRSGLEWLLENLELAEGPNADVLEIALSNVGR